MHMKFYKSLLLFYAFLCILFLRIEPAYAEDESINRFNVMYVLDASGSMEDTDPENYRFDAVRQFTNLLAQQGNHLGSVVFSTDIKDNQEPIPISNQDDKNQVVDAITSVPVKGWTNTGRALGVAVDELIASGDPKLPSVIVLLSDGNTEMGNDDETKKALEEKAEAIQRARENKVAIYSICLNANEEADVSEMQQISDATGGVFQEVKSAEDLRDVFNTFYNLIYGTSTIPLADEVFPDNGIIEKEFEVPGIGVEEVNIIINGKTTSAELHKPDDSISNAEVSSADSFMMMKVADVVPGKWKLITEGVPGDQIKINMVYNTNLSVSLSIKPEQTSFRMDEDYKLEAVLNAGGKPASSKEQYTGYEAELQVLDAYGEEISVESMQISDHGFVAKPELQAGTYFFKASVTGNHLEKESEQIGPYAVTEAVVSEESPEEEIKQNTPPEAIENPVEKIVYVWPIKGATLSIDLQSLAKDEDGDALRYKILSSSFVEGKDYAVEDDKLTVNHFSLSKGAFTVQATDPGGLSCEIEIIIKSRNVGLIALIALAAAILVGIMVFAIMTYKALGVAFTGSIDAENIETGVRRPMQKSRGRLKLASFQLGNTGIDGYFQATGKSHIFFISKKPVYDEYSCKISKKVKLESDMEIRIATDDTLEHGIRVSFHSFLR